MSSAALHFDLLVRNGRCILPWGEALTDIGIRDGVIVTLSAPASATAEQVLDASGLHVLPGLTDPHVHLRDPGNASVETIETGTRGAVLGGLTAVYDMPNTSPSIIDAETVQWKQGHIGQTAWCDMGFYVGATKTNIQDLATLEHQPGVCAVKVFAGSSTGDLLVEDDASIEAVMRSGHRRIAFHSEDEYRLQERRPSFSSGMPYVNHMIWRDEECAFLGTRRIMALARKTGRPAHILHTSTAEEFEYLKDFRDVATSEVLVNHLTQIAPECYETLGGYAVMNPPLRDRRHYEAAWKAVNDGLVDTIGSDHAPHPREAKERPWPDCAAGLTGVQTLLPVMLDHVSAGRLSLPRLVDLLAAGPARVYGAIGKGRLAVGYDGDLTLVDMGRQQRIEASWLASPCGWSPFEGRLCQGWPVATVLRGHVAMRDGALQGEATGRLISFLP
ncbi:dihydroorotase [Granulibacter bethesdensis]|uniref:dihydroorotase n=1 Tax=Granulibacter bethesdensis TaxID=364410 RepID=UPI0003F1F460|nr:dihydroorotase [Granulibacter bethesdensis]AHJ65217.1 Dihydroorotase [Granulibacter bethesdensis CGDNIH4]